MKKEIAFFWSGVAMSWMRYLTLFSFRKLNPDWKITLFSSDSTVLKKKWNNCDQQDFFRYDGKDYSHKLDSLDIIREEWDFGIGGSNDWSPVRQCDVFQWQWLANHSGFYADMDILFVRPMSSIPPVDVGLLYCVKQNHFPIGFLGSDGQHPFFGDVRDMALQYGDDMEYQASGMKAVNRIIEPRTQDIDQVFNEKYSQFQQYNLPTNVVYPYMSEDIFRFFIPELNDHALPECCVGIHWYAGAHISQDMNCRLTEDNFYNTRSVFTDRVENLLS